MTEIDTAVVRLSDSDRAVAAREFKSGRSDAEPGLYSWWADASGCADLAERLKVDVGPKIYAGQAGATRWPSGAMSDATIRSRITSNHLGSSIGASTFRWTLASLLEPALDLLATGPKKLDRSSERRLTMWMLDHMSVVTYAYPDRDGLGAFEEAVIGALDPPLNLKGVQSTSARRRLSALRKELGASSSGESSREFAPEPVIAEPLMRSIGKITLHEELVDILSKDGAWMTTAELARAVARRGRYLKRDGTSEVTTLQVHGRTKNYPNLFEKDGQRVRLLQVE